MLTTQHSHCIGLSLMSHIQRWFKGGLIYFLALNQALHCVSKLAIPLASNTPYLLSSSWISTKYCTLHYFNITCHYIYYDVKTLPCALSITSLWHHSLFTLRLCSVSCYWHGDQAAAHSPKTKSLQGKRWPLWAQTLKTSSEWMSTWTFHILYKSDRY